METSALNPAVADAQPRERVKPRLAEHASGGGVLGCSFWTARDYILQGLIPVVDMPPLRPREGDRQRKTLRRVLSIELTWMSLSNPANDVEDNPLLRVYGGGRAIVAAVSLIGTGSRRV